MSESSNSYLQNYLKRLNPTVEIDVKGKCRPDFSRPKMVRSMKSQSLEFGGADPEFLTKPRIARVRSSANQIRSTFDEPIQAMSPCFNRPKKLDPLIPINPPLSRQFSQLSITSSALGSEPSLSSVALVDHGISPDADDDDNPFYNDNIFVNRSLRNIRGSASKRRMAKRKTSTDFNRPPMKPATPVRDSGKPDEIKIDMSGSDLLNALSENRKKTRNRIRNYGKSLKISIDGQFRTLNGPFKYRINKETINDEIDKSIELKEEESHDQIQPEQSSSKTSEKIENSEKTSKYRFDPAVNENPFGRSSSSRELTGRGSSTYPGFEFVEESRHSRQEKRPPVPEKLTSGVREFKVCGKAKQMSVISNDNTEEDNEERPKPILRRQIQSKQRSRSTPAAILSGTAPILSPRSGQRRSSMNSSCVLNEKNKIQKSIQYLQLPDKEANWELTMEHINQIKESAELDGEILGNRISEVFTVFLPHINNLRSKISGLAIDSLRQMFDSLKNSNYFEKFLSQTIDTIIKRLLVEAAKENVFISEKCDKCFRTIVEVICEMNPTVLFKLISSFYQFSRDKSRVKVRCFSYLSLQHAIEHMEDKSLTTSKNISELFIKTMIGAFDDANENARCSGRRMVLLLSNSSTQFDTFCKKYLTAEQYQKIMYFKSCHDGSESLGGSSPDLRGRKSISFHRLRSTRSSFSYSSPKGKKIIIPGLKEELINAKKSKISKDRTRALQIMKQHIKERGSLGNEITNGVDLLCSSISSAASANMKSGFDVCPDFIPLLKNEKILLTNLVKVLCDKINSNPTTVIPLLDQIEKECSPSVLLPLFTNMCTVNSNGRSEIVKYIISICLKLKEQKPTYIIKYGKQAFWIICKDRNCQQQQSELAKILYGLMGDTFFEEANKQNLGTFVTSMI